MTSPRHTSSFADLAERRAWLASQPDTHATHRGENWPVGAWCRRTKDVETFNALRDWQNFNDMPRLVANDDDPRHPDDGKVVTQINTEMSTCSAEQLIYAHEHGMVRMVGNRLVKVFDGHRWRDTDEEFRGVRKAADPRIDAMHWHAEPPDAEAETIRAIDATRLRERLGEETCTVLDMAAGDSTLREIGEDGGYSGKYAERAGRRMLRAAISALHAA